MTGACPPPRRARATASLVALALLASLAGCGDDGEHPLEVAELMKPETCMTCHPTHFREWSGSMHAYAADDPVFLAMNRRGQAATGGALGDFCVKCHAPLAVELGLTQDGLNLADVPQWAKGVGCFFCHNLKSVEGDHNNPLILAMDATMRGGFKDPVRNAAHRSAYSPLIDGRAPESSRACGACHDIVNQRGVHVERTFAEWTTSIFAGDDPRRRLSCGQCHMIGNTDVIAEDPDAKVKLRPSGRREHTFAGLDVALTPWPERPAQRAAIERDLRGAVLAKLCVLPTNGGEITLRLDPVGVGHSWPSGATHDRRAWAEILGYDAGGAVIFRSGDVPVDQDPEDLADPGLFRLWDRALDAGGAPVKFMWEIDRLDTSLLQPAVTTDRFDPRFDHSTTKSYPIGALRPQLARVTARVLVRPLPLRLIDELAPELGDAAASLKAELPTFELSGATLEWTPAKAVSLCVE
ncbi:MAG: multiheme c-type cytochrome [Kofleriaceae bacterium]